jgi:hypothetical protein
MSYKEYWNEISKQSGELNSLISSYWHDYSSLGTWQFWVVLSLLILPLVLLYFTVDRSQIFLLFFFGYTVHILWAYTDIILERYGYFVHTFFLAPVFPHAFNMTVSALPVGYLLTYQYCINHNKNFLVYSLFLGALFAFGIAPLEMLLGILKTGKGLNLFHIFLIDSVIAYIAYFFTKIIKRLSDVKTS